ncbi:MAG: creatininase [Armatimonadetes bacterium CG_4_10_14_3_um_filter_66_18]|nr:creatininase family protein [Armatimonadota bacterium]OIP06436.1 MAG: creatininase [Armatimonadetes bacterium CG2_30_66_41]PIU92804.1 MAG: creatininase [Armatimonadetes bacterium CG06_land_8_20_14_3_00_66_21]PIW13112.1 MAG: creatininase [Armatimonadetes bacterium CG17_big_fil_post_rev_8_21_14_2_50_66_6]PIX46534.1 MAG: creatininase [Armatimonadetes bacterium CG_4_8_14_3_um_filter_66_20]PIY40588.1 MAG: creatininase [Armatimonadetes bacterium CG_4_10_14_3_um_filter_66_18]PIZ46882.1 MAG: creat
MAREWKLQEITYKAVQERDYEVAVLPVGATEPHGLHLPYGSDQFHTEIIADMACERAHRLGAKVIQLPTIPYGVDSNLLEFPLTMHVSQNTLNAMVADIADSLAQHEIHKLVLFNGHGGNEFKPLLRDLYGTTPMFLTLVNWWQVGKDVLHEIFEEPGDHADEMETSVNLALFPHLVHLEDADDGAVKQTRLDALNQGWASITRPFHLLTKNSGVGDPRKATKEKGQAYVAIVVDRISKFLKELSEAPMTETFPY